MFASLGDVVVGQEPGRLLAALGRAVAAVESDADLQALPALRGHLRRELANVLAAAEYVSSQIGGITAALKNGDAADADELAEMVRHLTLARNEIRRPPEQGTSYARISDPSSNNPHPPEPPQEQGVDPVEGPMSDERFEAWAKEIGLTDRQWLPVRVVLDREYGRALRDAAPLNRTEAQVILNVMEAFEGGVTPMRSQERAVIAKLRRWLATGETP